MPDYKEKIILPLAKRTPKAVGTLGVIILLLAIFFPYGAKAENVYTQTNDGSGYISASTTVNITTIGSFTTDSNSHTINSDARVQFYYRTTTNNCLNTDHFNIVIGTEENINNLGSIAGTQNIQGAGVTNTWVYYDEPFAGASAVLSPNTTYYVGFTANCGLIQDDWFQIKSNITEDQFFGVISDNGGFSQILIPNETRFTYLDPSGGEEVASSTSNDFYVDLYVNRDDYHDGAYVRIKYVRQQDLQVAVSNTDLLWTTIDLDDIITDGYHFLATTTSSLGLDGTYYFKAELRKPSSWWTIALSYINPFQSLDPDLIISSSTQFVYGEMTSFDRFVASTTQNIADYTASTTLDFEQAKNSCWSLSGFDFADCMNFMFGWQAVPMNNAMNNIKDNFFTYAPFGYVKRTYDIFATTSTTTLPVLSYTFSTTTASKYNPLAGETFSFDIWDFFFKDGSVVKDEIVSNDNGKNIWQIFEPIIKIIVYLSLLFIIFGELTGVEVMRSSSFAGKVSSDESYKERQRYGDWLYKHRKK